MNDMLIALQITALGMGLVFGAIILLWGMIRLLTSLTAEKDGSAPAAARAEATPDVDLKARAAAAAVALALAEGQTSGAHPLAVPPTTIVSAWQLGMRTRQMYQKGEPLRRQHR